MTRLSDADHARIDKALIARGYLPHGTSPPDEVLDDVMDELGLRDPQPTHEAPATWPALQPVPANGSTAQVEQPAPDLFKRWTMGELLRADRTFKWDIRGLLVRPTYGTLGGAEKTLKTHIGTLLDVALASGEPLFSHFEIDSPGPVIQYVGEGGRVPHTRLLERVCRSMGIDDPDSLPIFPTYDVAPIGSARFNESLERDLAEIHPALLHLDPLYAYHPPQTKGSSLYEEGAMLAGLSARCMEAGCSVLVNSHFNQSGRDMNLRRITMAGAAEWSDSWLLVAHREDPDVEGGHFKLLLEVGSRQWGGSRWELDLEVGRFNVDAGEFDGEISWQLRRGGTEASAIARNNDEDTRRRMLEALTDRAWEMTKTDLRELVGQDHKAFERTRKELVAGRVIGDVKKPHPEGDRLVQRSMWGVLATLPDQVQPSWPGAES